MHAPHTTHVPLPCTSPTMHAPPHDMVNERAVRILLECILVWIDNPLNKYQFVSYIRTFPTFVLLYLLRPSMNRPFTGANAQG